MKFEELYTIVVESTNIFNSLENMLEYALSNFDTELEDELTDEERERVRDYYYKYQDTKSDPIIKIYRAIWADSVNDIDFQNVGIFWSFEKNGAKPQNKVNGDKIFVLTGEVKHSQLDWEAGFLSYFYYGEDQWEANLGTDQEIAITEINSRPLKSHIPARTGSKFYNVWGESMDQQVINESFKDKLKLAALAAVFGIQLASLPTLNKMVKRYVNRMTPEKMEQISRQIEHEIDNPSPELINSVAKIEALSEETSGIPNKEPSRNAFLKTAAKFIIANEGFRNESYTDVYGYLTVGIGHLIKPTDIENGLFKDGEYTLDGKGNIIYAKLTDKRVYQLFLHDVESKILRIQNSFPNYEEYPMPLKIAILDGYFRGDVSGSPKTINLIRESMEKCLEGDIEEAKNLANKASVEFLNNNEYKLSVKNKTGVRGRMERLASFIAHAYEDGYKFDYTSSVYK